MFDFSFSNTYANGVAGTVTGTIYGLDNSGTSSATDIIVTSAPAGVGGTPPIDIFTLAGLSIEGNAFTVTGGNITAASFEEDTSPTSGTVPRFGINFGGNHGVFVNQFNLIDGQYGVENFDGFSGVTFTPVSSAMPEPSALALLGTTLAGLFLVRARTKRRDRLGRTQVNWP